MGATVLESFFLVIVVVVPTYVVQKDILSHYEVNFADAKRDFNMTIVLLP